MAALWLVEKYKQGIDETVVAIGRAMTDAAPENDDTGEGVRQTQRMRPPEPKEGMLNQQMAQQAAKQFKKREKKIQKACAELDDPEAANKKGCSCVIL